MAFHPIMRVDELWEGDMRGVTLRDARVLVLRTGDGVFAYVDRCAHLGIPLSENADLANDVVTCRAHEYRYDAATGKGINPRCAALVPLRTRCSDGVLYVDVQQPVPRPDGDAP